MQRLNNFIISLLHTFVVILEHVNQIPFLEVSTYPVLFGLVYQHSIAFEHSTSELTDV